MNTSRPLVTLEQCSLLLDDAPILEDVSFELRSGERWALIGANGSGKTMLLKMIRGDMWPTPTGRERRVYHLNDRERTTKQQIGYIGSERQDKYVRYDWNLSVTQLVTTGLFDEDIPLTKPTAAQRAKVERMMRRFGVWSLRARRFLTLSYGQRRLALVARAFVSDAPVLLLDEVFNGLDVKAKAKLREALEAPRDRHAWILTSHRPDELPRNVTNYAHIERGQLKVVSLSEARALRRAQGEGQASRALSRSKTSRRQLTLHARSELVEERRAITKGKGSSKRAADKPNAPDRRWMIRVTNADLFRDYRPVIRQLNWTVNRGEHWAVVGANGSGKSTLLSLVYGDMHPALGGNIERRGVPFGTHIAEWKKRVGWVSPELQADHYLAASLEEIVVSGRYSSVGLNDPATRADLRAADRWFEFFNIGHLRHRGPRQVSYGQMRLALIARAMMNEPELLLLDEPCTGLDGDVREYVLDVLQRIAQRGTQLIMAVHDATDIVPAVQNVLRIKRGGEVSLEQLPPSK